MPRKTPVDKLNESIAKILQQYQGEVKTNVGEIAEQIGKKGVAALRETSRKTFKPTKGKHPYASGWKMKVEKTRVDMTKVTIYNEHFWLPHLLENGHVTRNGLDRVYPRTPAHPHIAPVEKELVESFEREVKSKL